MSGLTFGSRYKLLSRVAIGGMGEVWQATDLVIGRTVAIKILKDEYLGDPGFLERFRAEARHAALVNHEGIANVYDYGEEEGSAFLVMELVPGEALSTILERERVLPEEKVLDFIAQTASALHAAHQAGLVHRDIKPGNLLITPDGRVKITDFGIARIADQVPLTATGQVMGTVQYLSPEQASGHPASPSTDIYSLGIVAYEALAGRRPFTGESQVAIAMAQINDAPPELPVTVSEPVRNLVFAAIAKKPANRPGSAQLMARAAQALRRGDVAGAVAIVPTIASGEAATAATRMMPAGDDATRVLPKMNDASTTSLPIEKRRSPWTWPLVALIALLLVFAVGGLFALLGNGNTPEQEPSTPPTAVATPTPTPTPTETPIVETINLDESEWLGLTRTAIDAQIENLDLRLDPQVGNIAPTAGESGLSYQINPRGGIVQPGTVITVFFYAPIPIPPQPSNLAVDPGSGPYPGSSEVVLSWPAYSECPAGFPLTGYDFTIVGGTQGKALPLAARESNLPVTLAASGQLRVTYVALCGSLRSERSNELALPIESEPTIPIESELTTPIG